MAARRTVRHSEDYGFRASSDCALRHHHRNAITPQATPKLPVPRKSCSFFASNATDSGALALARDVRLVAQLLGAGSAQQRRSTGRSAAAWLAPSGALQRGVAAFVRAVNWRCVSVIPAPALPHLRGSKSAGKTAPSGRPPQGRGAWRLQP